MHVSDHRVEFDFEVEFSNSGGLQGQGFRLDIDDDDIADDELADYLVRDLGLLMVGDVRILRKRILRERHKRRAGGGRPAAGPARQVRIDLSHTIAMCANTGTYVDSPFHRYVDGDDLSALPLDRLADLDAIAIDVTGSAGGAVDRTHLAPYEVGGKAVLIHTGWDRHWGSNRYFEGHPFLTPRAAAHLVAEGALLVGIDSLNIDDTSGGERPVHSTLLAAGIPICEHLTGLEALPPDGFRFSAVPVKVKGLGAFPVRAYATLG